MSLTIEKSSWYFQSSKLASTTFFDKTSSEIALSLHSPEEFKKSTNFQESKYNSLTYNALQRKLRTFPP
jgi:hypothetical protein